MVHFRETISNINNALVFTGRLTHQAPQVHFGWGGKKPLPRPDEYTVALTPTDIRISTNGVISFHPDFITALYKKVFRQNLDESGFSVITGLKKISNNNPVLMRKIQFKLGEALTKKREEELGQKSKTPFTPKYMGRSNKLKLNPTHCDTKYQDSLALMLYEPAQDVRGFPYIADLSQFAKDNNTNPESLMITGESLKTHYGNQLKKEVDPEIQDSYALDLEELDQHEYPLVILNDSISNDNYGHVHGVRHLEILGENPSRPFNHLVIDTDRNESTEVPPTYFQKGIPENEQTAISESEAVDAYISDGTIYYRSDSNR